MASYYLKGYTTPDGVNSRADVREWQSKLGVKADGIWGPNTQAAYERYANASSMSKFQEYYDTILGALNVPSISVSVPSKAELKEDISGYLRPGVDLAISKRRAAGETAKAELDADAVSRGMGASTYVSSMKEREDDDVAYLYKYDGSGQDGDDLYFNVTLGENTYTFTVESYLCDNTTDVYNAVKNLSIGDKIDMEGFLYWYEGVNPHITSVTPAA